MREQRPDCICALRDEVVGDVDGDHCGVKITTGVERIMLLFSLLKK